MIRAGLADYTNGLLAKETAGFLVMAAARTNAFGQGLGHLAGVNLLDAASDRKLYSERKAAVNEARIKQIDLQQHVADKSQNIRITGLSLGNADPVFDIKDGHGEGLAGNRDIRSRKVRVS